MDLIDRAYKDLGKHIRRNWHRGFLNEKKFWNKDAFRAFIYRYISYIGRDIIDYESGVLVDGLGYFANWKTATKVAAKPSSVIGRAKMVTSNRYCGGFYVSELFNDVYPNSFLRGWTFEKSFHPKIKHRRYIKLLRGCRYKCNYTTIKSIYNPSDK